MKITRSMRSIAKNAASALQMQIEIERLKKNALRRGKKKRRDHIVPLRKKRGRRDYGRYMKKDPVFHPERQKANRARRVNRVFRQIQDVLGDSTMFRAGPKIRAILERIL